MAEGPAESDAELPAELAERLCAIVAGPAEERSAALAALVAAHPAHAAALQQGAHDILGADSLLARSFPRPDDVPARIGRYRVLSLLGEGAFGSVYLGAEDEPVRREVAIKLLRPGAGDRRTLQRFASERQLLAELSHPSIVRVLDAGTVADGRPFFVMDCVDGMPLTAWCRAHALPLRARLQLFVDVCHGVQHAHARGIVHRDLKPANVLVTAVDGRPAPRIIDFGIAKSLATDDAERPQATETGRVVGTPGYMSPEQRRGAKAAVDARSDVFSLGVMLFELLTGERPFADDDTRESTDREPPRASTHRHPGRPTGRGEPIAGELDWIVARALAARPDDRYPSAGALGDDVARHLAGEAITAGRPSTLQRAVRTLRRHRAAVATAIAAAAMLTTIASAAWFQSVGEAREQSHADDTLALADRLLARAEAAGADADDGLVEVLLRESHELRERVLANHASRPAVLVQQVRTLGHLTSLQFLLGRYAEEVALARSTLALARELAAADAAADHRLELAKALRDLARGSYQLGDHEAAREHGREAIALLEALLGAAPGPIDKLLAKTLVEHASAVGRLGDGTRQLALQEQALATLTRFHDAHGDDAEAQRDLVRFRCGLATLRRRRGDLDGADAALDLAARDVAALPRVTDEERALVAMRQCQLRRDQDRHREAIAAGTGAVAILDDLIRRHPGRAQERTNRILLRSQLFDSWMRVGEPAAADAQVASLLAEAAWPGDALATPLADSAVGIARTLLATDRVAAFAPVIELLTVAAQRLQAKVPMAAADRGRHRDVQIARATLCLERGRSLPPAEVAAIVATIPDNEAAVRVFGQWLLVWAHLDAGAADAAAAALTTLPDDQPDPRNHVAVAIRVAASRRDREALASALAHASALPDGPDGVRLTALAAASLVELDLGDDNAAPTSPALATVRRRVATWLANEPAPAAAEATTPRAYAFARIVALAARLGIASDAATRSSALTILDQRRGLVGAPGWDETSWQSLHTTVVATALTNGGCTAALAALRQWAPACRDPLACRSFCAAAAACLGDADANAAEADPIARLAASLLAALPHQDAGLRAALTADPQLAPLRAHPAFAAVLRSVEPR